MSADVFTLHSEVLPKDALVVGFRGHEALSEPYRFEIGFITHDPTFIEDDAVMGRATLRVDRGLAAPPYETHGILASIELLHAFGDKLLYRAVLVPQVWQLSLTNHSNVWTDRAIPDVIKDVLLWSGLGPSDFELRLEGSYPNRELVAQYKESNLQFIQRWMERLGLYYFFEQGDEREKLVILDGRSFASADAVPARYRPLSDDSALADEAFEWFHSKAKALPSSVELIDYDYLNPALELRSSLPSSKAGYGEINRFGEDFFATPSAGDKLAKLRVEALVARQKVVQAKGRVYHLRAGGAFVLDEHPRVELNDRPFLITAISHQGNQAAKLPSVMKALGLEGDELYTCKVTAIPGDVQYRTQVDRSAWPRVEGYECATVCGTTASPYAQLDGHGRYKVRIHFDESDLGDGKASAWVRMQQPYGGTKEGFHFPLLKGTEVALSFQGGDPDRPMIAGVVPNAVKPSVVTEKNHTQNVIHTVNDNLIKIEDLLGQQFVFIQCPISNTWIHMGVLNEGYNLVLNTEGHTHFAIGGDQVIDVALSLTETVHLDATLNYNENFIVNVLVDNNITIQGVMNVHVVGDVNYDFDAIWKSKVLGDTIIDVTGVMKVHVEGNVTEDYDADVAITVLGNEVVNITGNASETVVGNYDFTLDGTSTVVIQGASTTNYASTYKLSVAGATDESFWGVKVTCNGGLTSATFIGLKNSNMIGGEISTIVGAKIEALLALKASLHLGLNIEIDGAPKICIGVPRLDQFQMKMNTVMGPYVLAGAIMLATHGIAIHA
ncbi:MAG: type VI secretion system tip protein VgrG [Myxococcales bacterium]|nr:type VI secretion system tip protein VgrG [Myxococcales bacterium]